MARIVVTGGAGFLGSHLSRALCSRGDEVVAVDNLITGALGNIGDLVETGRFTFVEHDVTATWEMTGPVDALLHFASPASPTDFDRLPIEILTVGSRGTQHCLELARAKDARFLLASTSEVYGDPHVHPQPEWYMGNSSPVGPRSAYDEAKRYAEALTMAYARRYGLRVGIARIFNMYGPHMRPDDGRVVPSFIRQALDGGPLTIYGDGRQTRSFTYVNDGIEGLLALLDSGFPNPVNIGNPDEVSITKLAELTITMTASSSPVIYESPRVDDPVRRCPDIDLARRELGWEPATDLPTGLQRTMGHFVRDRGAITV